MSTLFDGAKSIGSFLFGLCVFFGLMFLLYFVFAGGVWLGVVVYPIVATISGVTFLVSLLFILPLGLFSKTKNFSGNALMLASLIIGFSTWIWSFLLTYSAWGFIGLFIGLVFMGIGVVPVAMLASLLNAEWSILAQLVLSVVVIYGFRILGIRLIESSSRQDVENTKNLEVFQSDKQEII